MYMNPFEMVGYVALGFVPTLVAMKIGWDLARKKILFSYLKRDNVYAINEPTTFTTTNI
jgi:hypothetical protein